MPVLAVGNTVYTRPVAKVMISIPDEILERIDAHLRESRETRSGFLRRLAEREIDAENAKRRREFEDLLGPPVAMGPTSSGVVQRETASLMRSARSCLPAALGFIGQDRVNVTELNVALATADAAGSAGQ